MTKILPAKSGLERLREPFPAHHISKLPKPTTKQTEEVRADFKKGIRCQLCGQWHHRDVVHLDYVGHAALTDRLLECDPMWNWEPLAMSPSGTPLIDEHTGMWIRLTVCGITRLGYGHPDGKKGGNAIKEVIGDALRNAAMRFGAALDLWHKGDLHGDDEPAVQQPPFGPAGAEQRIIDAINKRNSEADLTALWRDEADTAERIGVEGKDRIIDAFRARKANLSNKDLKDHIPY